MLKVHSVLLGMLALVAGTAVWQPLLGQTSLGSISGIVTDKTGAVIVGSPVTVTDLDRNVVYRVRTNESGLYAVGSLGPGRYRIVAEMAGFRRYELDSLPLSTQQKASVDIVLQVGATSESVQVSAAAQMIEPGTATLGAH